MNPILMAGFWGKKRKGLKSKRALILRLLPEVFFEVLPELFVGSVFLFDTPLPGKAPQVHFAHLVNVLLSHRRWFGWRLLQSLSQLTRNGRPTLLLEEMTHQIGCDPAAKAAGNNTQSGLVPVVEAIDGGLAKDCTRGSQTKLSGCPGVSLQQQPLVVPSELDQVDTTEGGIREWRSPDSTAFGPAKQILLLFLPR